MTNKTPGTEPIPYAKPAGKKNPGRRAMRDALAPRLLVAVKPSARNTQTAPFVEPKRVDLGSLGLESQRNYARRVELARAAYDRAQRAGRAKAFTYGPNARRVNPLVRSPYPPWAVFGALVDDNPPGSRESESGYQLAGIRRAQRNERKRGRVPGVTGAPSGTGWGKVSGKILEARRAAYVARLELRRIARRVKRHGGPFSKATRAIVARLQSEQMRGVK